MNPKALVGMIDVANGNGLFNNLAVCSLWHVLVASKVLPKQEALNALDAALLTLERQQAKWRGNPAVIEEARSRMEGLIAQIGTISN